MSEALHPNLNPRSSRALLWNAPRGLAAVTLVVGVTLPLVAWAQPIIMPDFRGEVRATSSCANCGTVRSVREKTVSQERAPAAGLTPEAGSAQPDVLVGAVFVHSFSDTSASYAGGVGTPEMRARFSTTSYELTLRMDDGSYRLIERRDGARFQPGDRVRVVQSSLQLL